MSIVKVTLTSSTLSIGVGESFLSERNDRRVIRAAIEIDRYQYAHFWNFREWANSPMPTSCSKLRSVLTFLQFRVSRHSLAPQHPWLRGQSCLAAVRQSVCSENVREQGYSMTPVSPNSTFVLQLHQVALPADWAESRHSPQWQQIQTARLEADLQFIPTVDLPTHRRNQEAITIMCYALNP